MNFMLYSLFSRVPRKLLVALALALVALYAVTLRCLHLLNDDHYYIVSHDSYYFHWIAELVQSGETQVHRFSTLPQLAHSGLVYPLAYTAKIISFVFGASGEDALAVASKLLPPALAVLGVIVIYLAVARMYDRRVALFSAFVWASLALAVYPGAGGYLDRDGLSLLLVMAGVFAFYLSRHWHWRVGKHDLGWAVGALAVVAFEGLLYAEWTWLGPAVLLTILAAALAAETLGGLYRRIAPRLAAEGDPLDLMISETRHLPRNTISALRESNWRPFVLVFGLTLLVASITPGLSDLYGQVRAGWESAGVASLAGEMLGLGPGDMFNYRFLLVPLFVGLYISAVRRRPADLLCLGWFVSLLLVGMLTKRVFIYATPAACILAGIGLRRVLEFRIPDPLLHRLQVVGAGLLIILIFVLAVPQAYSVGSGGRSAPNNSWHDALVYLRDNTAPESRVMSWWDYGYWILDLGERMPVVDNGFHPDEADIDIAHAYFATDESETIDIMLKYKADYLVFSEIELLILPHMTNVCFGQAYGDGREIPWEIQDSVFARSLSGNLQAERGLSVFYRNDQVVILENE